MPNNEQNNENKNNKKLDWKLLTSCGVSVIAVVIALVALIKGGPAGQAGAPGQSGNNGSSAYEIAVANGFSGTEEDWLESLHAQSEDSSLDSLDDYFELIDSTRKFNYAYKSVDRYADVGDSGDTQARACLTNFEDAEEIYNTVTPATYTLKSHAKNLPVVVDEKAEDYSEGQDGSFMVYDYTYLVQSSKSSATFEINRVGSGSDSYVGIHFTSFREVTTTEFSVYFESLSSENAYTMYVYDFGEFCKIGDSYYMIYACPTFGYTHYIIQEFSEDVYKLVVSSIIYEVSNFAYHEGKDYYIGDPRAQLYLNNFVGTKTNNSAKASMATNYVSEVTFEEDELVSLKTSFNDSLGFFEVDETLFIPPVNEIEQELGIIHEDSNHVYPSALPSDQNWANASAFWCALDSKELISDLDVDQDIYSSLIYEIVDILRNTYIGIGFIN